MSESPEHIETRLARAGCEPDPVTGAVSPPIHLATTFQRDPDGSYPRGYRYGREASPTRSLLERAVADLDGGAAAAAFSSGMAAANAVLQTLETGAHIILPEDVYHGVRSLLHSVYRGWGLEWTAVDTSRPERIAEAMRPETRLVWAESPSNPLLHVTDLRAVAQIAHEGGAAMLADGTWAPLIQRTLDLGADLVLHSVTKYLSGHSDVLGGVIVARADDDRFARIRLVQKEAGAVLDPFSSWLTLRGMRSLSARMRVHCENARAVAAFLDGHPAVERVNYPGLASHPGHDVAGAQMSAPGGMLSFQVAADEAGTMAVVAGARVFQRATSLGGTESLIEHRASVEGPLSRTPRNLVRLSVGLEHPDDLVADLERALAAV